MHSMLFKTYPKYFALFNGFRCLLQTIKVQLFISICDMFTNVYFLFCFLFFIYEKKIQKRRKQYAHKAIRKIYFV